MSSTNGEDVNLPFFDVDEAREQGERLIESVADYTRRLRLGSLSTAAIVELDPIGERLSDEVANLAVTISELETKEAFGGEESYWNAYRLFCAENNLGLARSLEETWDHLAKTFNMSDETPETVRTTLLEEWNVDFEADVLERRQIVGNFGEVEGKLVFYKIRDLAPQKHSPTPKVARAVVARPEPETPQQPETPVVELEPRDIGREILMLLAEQSAPVRQAGLIKGVLQRHPDLTHADVYAKVTALVEAGSVHKFKPKKGMSPQLSLEAHTTVVETQAVQPATPEKLSDTQIELAYKLCEILTGSGQKPTQMVATSQLINRINDDEEAKSTVDVSELNAVVRLLAKKGIVVTDMGSPLRGRRKGMSQAKKLKVFRVGLDSAEAKVKLRQLLTSNTLELALTESLETAED